MEQVHYQQAMKKCLLLSNTHFLRLHNQLTAASAPTPYIMKVQLRKEGSFQTASNSETSEFNEL
jgi:hypothetical protein